ncbi:MAG TPA: hypothetical protein VKX49_27125 [Bryobacteraceae bacterium]|nr:hypothetical protein [Bryobacteraceae bacterium]
MTNRVVLVLLASVGSAWCQNPAFSGNSVVNAASFQTPVAPGSLATIFGSNLASTTAQADTIPLSTSLGGVTVQFVQGSNTYTAPLLFASPGDPANSIPSQVNVQIPWEVVPGGAPVSAIVSVNGNASAPQQINVGPLGPGIFASSGRAIAVNNADNTLAWPAGAVPGLTSHGARAGDVVVIYASGLGALDNSIPDGTNPQLVDGQLRNTATTPTVMVGNVPAPLVYSVLSPQFVGVNQLAIKIPSNAPIGDQVPLQIQEGGVTSPASTTISVIQ